MTLIVDWRWKEGVNEEEQEQGKIVICLSFDIILYGHKRHKKYNVISIHLDLCSIILMGVMFWHDTILVTQ